MLWRSEVSCSRKDLVHMRSSSFSFSIITQVIPPVSSYLVLRSTEIRTRNIGGLQFVLYSGITITIALNFFRRSGNDILGGETRSIEVTKKNHLPFRDYISYISSISIMRTEKGNILNYWLRRFELCRRFCVLKVRFYLSNFRLRLNVLVIACPVQTGKCDEMG